MCLNTFRRKRMTGSARSCNRTPAIPIHRVKAEHSIVKPARTKSRAAIGNRIGAVRLRPAEHRDCSGQRRFSSGTHARRLGSEADGVDADIAKSHEGMRRKQQHYRLASSLCRVLRSCRISTLIFVEDPYTVSCIGNGMNAGWSAH